LIVDEYVACEKEVMMLSKTVSPLELVILRERGRANGPEMGEYVYVGCVPQFATFMGTHDAPEEESRNWTFAGFTVAPPESTLRPNQYGLDPLFIAIWIVEEEDDSSPEGDEGEEGGGTSSASSDEPAGLSEFELQVVEHSSLPRATKGILALFITSVPPVCTLP